MTIWTIGSALVPAREAQDGNARVWYHSAIVARLRLAEAYPGIAFRPRTWNWWARLTGAPAECLHLETEQRWMATLIPDTLYLRGKAAPRRDARRPEVSLCRDCLIGFLRQELAAFPGRVVAFEPDGKSFTQYFYVAEPDFERAGLEPDVRSAIGKRLAELRGPCTTCSKRATWLWLTRADVPNLDNASQIATVSGRRLCAAHGAETLCDAFAGCEEANLFYVNVPYGEAGAYVWI